MSDLQASFDSFQKSHPLQCCLVDGQSWEYILTGEGDNLLMLPGFFGVAGTDFRYILAFEGQYRVISVTYPQAGNSVSALVDGLAAFMDGMGIAQVHLLGGSYSGYIAQAFVRRYPQRVGGLILAQTGPPRRKYLPLAFLLSTLFRWIPPGASRWLMSRITTWFLPLDTPQQSFWRAYFLGLIQSFSHRAVYNRFRVALDYHRSYRFSPADLAGWPGDILILESSHDNLLSSEDLKSLRRLYPQAQCRIISGDHVQSVDQPGVQIAAILRFLQGRL
jgi:pimeloyl-ACP methyl ester carboxylesterase